MPQVFLLLAISILTTASAQLCLKKGILMLGELSFSPTGIFQLISRIFQNIYLFGGVVLFGFSFLLWLFVLSKIQLSIAYPIALSCEVTLAAIGSYFLFKEHLSLFQILGIIFVISGIFLLLAKV